MNNTRLIVVLGMHRSGTSALAGVLQKQGVELGHKLMEGIGDVNDLGFFEHEEIVRLDEEILDSLGYSWLDIRPLPELWWKDKSLAVFSEKIKTIILDEFADKQLWGIKDPRMCRLLPFWLEILEETGCIPKIIIIVRHPLEVSRSLSKRDEMDVIWGCILWLWHVLEAFKWSTGYKRVVIKYDELLNDWTAVSEKISQELEIDWPRSINEARKDIETFLDVQMKHHHSIVKDKSENYEIVNLAIDVYENLFVSNIQLDELEEEFHNKIKRIEPYLKEISSSLLKASKLRNDIRNLESEKNIALRNLALEKTNAREQIEYRDKLIDELKVIIDELHDKLNDFWFVIKRPVIILIKKIFL